MGLRAGSRKVVPAFQGELGVSPTLCIRLPDHALSSQKSVWRKNSDIPEVSDSSVVAKHLEDRNYATRKRYVSWSDHPQLKNHSQFRNL